MYPFNHFFLSCSDGVYRDTFVSFRFARRAVALQFAVRTGVAQLAVPLIFAIGQGVHFEQMLFTLPWGQGLQT